MSPYIKEQERWKYAPALNELSVECIRDAGELNYVITSVVQQYLINHGERYRTYNDIIGVLECAKLEIYRRRVANYEDIKIDENGDVY